MVSPCSSLTVLRVVPKGLKLSNLSRRSQHVHGLPGGRRGAYRVARPDGDVSDREAAQAGESQMHR